MKIPRGWKRTGEATVYWEVGEPGDLQRARVRERHIALMVARESRGSYRVARITRHRLIRTDATEKLLRPLNPTPDEEVGRWSWGRGEYQSVGMFRERRGQWSLWSNGERLDCFGSRAEAEQSMRAALRAAGYNITKEGA